MAFNEDSSASGHDEPWIQWFCGLKGHEMFCEVERSYIEDGFNLYGLRQCVQNFSDCLDLILDRIGPDDSDDSHLTQNACTLYGLIHARYIITAHGLDAMYNKYASKEFGTCPLIPCGGQPVLPVGLRDDIGADTVKVFCPKCQSVYHPPPVRSRSNHGNSGAGGNSGVDGASFGTTFPHLFLMTFSNLVPDPLLADSAYIPRIFGFRVHQSARQVPNVTVANTTSTQMITVSVRRGGDGNDNVENRNHGDNLVEEKGDQSKAITDSKKDVTAENTQTASFNQIDDSGKERPKANNNSNKSARSSTAVTQDKKRTDHQTTTIEGVENGASESACTKKRKRPDKELSCSEQKSCEK